jgi:uncharacterized membrane protein YiaA
MLNLPRDNQPEPDDHHSTTNRRLRRRFLGRLLIGATAYLIGLWNAQMQLNEKGYYLHAAAVRPVRRGFAAKVGARPQRGSG